MAVCNFFLRIELGLKRIIFLLVTWQVTLKSSACSSQDYSDIHFKLFPHFLLAVASVQWTARLLRCWCLHSYPRRRALITTNPILPTSRSDSSSSRPVKKNTSHPCEHFSAERTWHCLFRLTLHLRSGFFTFSFLLYVRLVALTRYGGYFLCKYECPVCDHWTVLRNQEKQGKDMGTGKIKQRNKDKM